MPSFFEGLKRIVQGKPVFDPQDQPGHTIGEPAAPTAPVAPTAPTPPQNGIKKGDSRTFPVVYVKRTNTKINGPNMQVYCRILNSSRGQIMLDKIRLLGRATELDDYLRAGEEKEYLVYSGVRMPQQNYHEALLDYRTADGDYFQAIHDVRFNFHPDTKTYSIEEFRLHPPIRDIYG